MAKKEINIMKKNKQIELLLSILIAIAISYSLGIFVTDLNDSAWLVLSLFSIAAAIVVIYFMLGLKPKEKSEWVMLVTLGLGMLLPFSFKKMLISSNTELAITGFIWTQKLFFIHLILFGISLIIWGAMDKDKRNLVWTGIIWIIAMVLFAVLSGGILKNG